MKSLRISVCAFIIFIAGANISNADFNDVPQTHKNYIAITFLKQSGVVKGYEDGTYKPDRLVNRAESLKIIFEGNGISYPESVRETGFSDVNPEDWFSVYVVEAKNTGIINGNPDGTYAPERDVNRAEFIKIILNTNNFNKEKWENVKMFPDIPENEWFTPFINYAGQAGLIMQDDAGNLNPGEAINRGEVAEIMYIMKVILNGSNTQFLITQAEKQMSQIDIYIGDNNPLVAKRAAELSIDMTQQAYKNMPEDAVVLGAAKLARAYDFLVNAYLAGIQQNYTETEEWANKAVNKATEAWEVNNDTQPIARHIKDRASEILSQIPKS